MSEEYKFLKFVPFVSSMDPGFWYKMRDLKLNELGLKDNIVSINANYCNYTADRIQACLNIDYDALDKNTAYKSKFYGIKGKLRVLNNVEELMTLDRPLCLKEEGEKLWACIKSESILSNPSHLLSYSLFTYADLKKFKFHYTALHTALIAPDKFKLMTSVMNLNERFRSEQIESLCESHDDYVGKRLKENLNAQHVFLVRESRDGGLSVEDLFNIKGIKEDEEDKILVAFSDASSMPEHPSWPLRNILIAISYHCHSTLRGKAEVLCWRDRTRSGQRSVQHSIVFTVSLPDLGSLAFPPEAKGWEKVGGEVNGVKVIDLSASMDPAKLSESAVDLNLKLMKWRLAPQLDLDLVSKTTFLLLGSGTLGCNVARCLLAWGVRNITMLDNSTVSFSNPVRQSLFTFKHCLNGGASKSQAAAESLKEIFPSVNAVGVTLNIPMPGHFVTESTQEAVENEVNRLLDLIKSHDVLLLLMDTRESRWLPTLLGRCHGKIVVSVALGFDTYLVIRHATGFPTHQNNNNNNNDNNKQNNNNNNNDDNKQNNNNNNNDNNKQNNNNINDNNKQNNKNNNDNSKQNNNDNSKQNNNDNSKQNNNNEDEVANNNINKKKNEVTGDELGCYFCNDVTSPGNSTADRSMDQQCTVTRPGVSMVAASLAVEMIVSLLNHPLKGKASALIRRRADDRYECDQSVLGIIPHQIRGFLSHYETILPTCQSFNRCVACSTSVADEYRKDGFSFLLRVFNTPNVLEDLTGLTTLRQQVDAQEVIDFPCDSDSEN